MCSVFSIQIGNKFRDEYPRYGLLRSREFIMKDLYTFDSNKVTALQTYEELNDIYRKLFTFIGVPFVKGIWTILINFKHFKAKNSFNVKKYFFLILLNNWKISIFHSGSGCQRHGRSFIAWISLRDLDWWAKITNMFWMQRDISRQHRKWGQTVKMSKM